MDDSASNTGQQPCWHIEAVHCADASTVSATPLPRDIMLRVFALLVSVAGRCRPSFLMFPCSRQGLTLRGVLGVVHCTHTQLCAGSSRDLSLHMSQEPVELVSKAALVSRQWRELATSSEAWKWRLIQPMPPKLAFELVRNYGGLRPWPCIWARLRPSNLLQSLAAVRTLSPMYDAGTVRCEPWVQVELQLLYCHACMGNLSEVAERPAQLTWESSPVWASAQMLYFYLGTKLCAYCFDKPQTAAASAMRFAGKCLLWNCCIWVQHRKPAGCVRVPCRHMQSRCSLLNRVVSRQLRHRGVTQDCRHGQSLTRHSHSIWYSPVQAEETFHPR